MSLFPNSRIVDVQRFGEEGPGKEGLSTLYRFELNGVEYRALDSAAHHAFTFTPSMSLFVECDSEAEIDRLYAALSDGGGALMPLRVMASAGNSAGSTTGSACPGNSTSLEANLV